MRDVLLGVVVVTDQVQDAMYNHAIKFVLELGPIEGRVLPDGIDTDEEVAVQVKVITMDTFRSLSMFSS